MQLRDSTERRKGKIVMLTCLRLGVAVAVILSAASLPGRAWAWECLDCSKKCCTTVDLGLLGSHTVCESTCQTTCAAANVGCGKIDPTPPGLPPGTISPVPIPPVGLDPAVGLAILTGGMVNPVTQKAVNDAIWNLNKAVKDAAWNLDKAGKDAEAEVGRVGRDAEALGNAAKHYGEAVVKGTGLSLNKAFTRVREGKVVDALWHMGTDRVVTESDAAAAAAQESSILRTVGQVSASVYGGPTGCAAYAAWLAYYQSGGDVNLALRVGIISGATAYAMAGAGDIPTRNATGELVASAVAKRAAVTGAIGGLAIAAAGGDENAVRDGFLRAGAMVLIQEGYREYTKHPLSETDREGKPSGLKASRGDAYCVSTVVNCRTPPPGAAKIVDGEFQGWDQSKLDPSAPHVGNSSDLSSTFKWPATGEGAPIMTAISKIPGANAMAVFHDQWALGWNMPPGVLQATIYPAVILTYNGTSAPLMEMVREQAVKKNANSSAAGPTAAQAAPPDGAGSVILVNRDAIKADPIQQQRLEVAYSCATSTDDRSIAVEVDDQKKTFACRVVYRAKGQRTVPWRAANDTQYCYKRAMKLANTQVDAGYLCGVAFATPRR